MLHHARRWMSRASRCQLRVQPFVPGGERSGEPDSLGNQVELRGSVVRMDWKQRPDAVLVVKKTGLPAATRFVDAVASFIQSSWPGTRVMVEHAAHVEHPHLSVLDKTLRLADQVDVVVCAGYMMMMMIFWMCLGEC